mmetsp:Transcript_16147/g.43909  ORF Transcript_16147/g.43909 Transcript_16147/m.43909 type:complete len:265 (-) Transcript_16147:1510-2304(-)
MAARAAKPKDYLGHVHLFALGFVAQLRQSRGAHRQSRGRTHDALRKQVRASSRGRRFDQHPECTPHERHPQYDERVQREEGVRRGRPSSDGVEIRIDRLDIEHACLERENERDRAQHPYGGAPRVGVPSRIHGIRHDDSNAQDLDQQAVEALHDVVDVERDISRAKLGRVELECDEARHRADRLRQDADHYHGIQEGCAVAVEREGCAHEACLQERCNAKEGGVVTTVDDSLPVVDGCWLELEHDASAEEQANSGEDDGGHQLV